MITLKTLPEATSQQVFDQVAVHLLKQNATSELHSGDCAYRGLNGLKCAAGCLISDDEYKQDFEGCRWNDIAGKGSNHFDLIRELQVLHDFYEPVYWREKLSFIANDFGLTTDVLKEEKV